MGSCKVAHKQEFWPRTKPLFAELPKHIEDDLAALPGALARVWLLSAKHRQRLAEDIAALSKILTSDRAQLRRPYWSRPAFVSAYLYYFLPWNLLRLLPLLRALPLPAPKVSAGGRALLLDLGSGPLTLPLALWLAHPEWRNLPVEVLAVDVQRKPLELGKALFCALAEMLKASPWQIRLVQSSLESLPRELKSINSGRTARETTAWLCTSANTLNELLSNFRHERHTFAESTFADADAEWIDERFEAGIEAFFASLSRIAKAPSPGERSLNQGGASLLPASSVDGAFAAMLLIEPGTRLGGTAMMRLRSLALDYGFVPLAPCTHSKACPLLERAEGRRGKSHADYWCHFGFVPKAVPRWLRELSKEAGLEKDRLSLSTLLLTAQAAVPASAREIPLRVLSGPFPVPGHGQVCRYACFAGGLALLEEAKDLPCGGLLAIDQGLFNKISSKTKRDARSSALILAPGERKRAAMATATPGNEPLRHTARGGKSQAACVDLEASQKSDRENISIRQGFTRSKQAKRSAKKES